MSNTGSKKKAVLRDNSRSLESLSSAEKEKLENFFADKMKNMHRLQKVAACALVPQVTQMEEVTRLINAIKLPTEHIVSYGKEMQKVQKQMTELAQGLQLPNLPTNVLENATFYVTRDLVEEERDVLVVPQTPEKPPKKAEDVRKLELIPPERGSYYAIIVNEDYTSPVRVDGAKQTWGLLLEVAKNGYVSAPAEFKQSVDYLNSHPGCRLYSKTHYRRTKILKKEGPSLWSAENVNIETISEKAFKTRRRKQEET